MKAIVYEKYGPPDVLELKEVAKPTVKDNEVLVKVHATTVNRTDTATIRAKPFIIGRLMTGLWGPKKQTPGTEFAGKIEEIGKNVKSLQVGDNVFGFDHSGSGSHAEYLTISEDKALTTPKNITYEQAAASSEGAHYAYSFIKKVNVKSGKKILVNGATGAIGSAAVQLLKSFEADVTATCNTKNIELVKSLGADKVIDYTKDDFTKDDQKYHFIFDAVGKSTFGKCKPLLHPGGIYISSDLGPGAQNIFLPIITPIIKPMIGNKKIVFPIPTDIRGTLLLIKKLTQEGKFKPVIDRKYSLGNIVEAYKYVETGQKTGNVVITLEHNNKQLQQGT